MKARRLVSLLAAVVALALLAGCGAASGSKNALEAKTYPMRV